MPRLKGVSFETAIIERLNRDIRRRTRVVGAFPDGNSAFKIARYQLFPINKKQRQPKDCRCSVLALPIFPGRHQPSIVSRNELNYRVRNGNGWTLTLINTNYVFRSFRRTSCIIPFSSRFVKKDFGDPYRIRTDVNGVRGRCLNHLTNGPWCTFTDSNRGPTD